MFAKRTVTALVLASFIGLQPGIAPAWADNQMGYGLLPAAEADALPKAGGTLGLNVGPGETDHQRRADLPAAARQQRQGRCGRRPGGVPQG